MTDPGEDLASRQRRDRVGAMIGDSGPPPAVMDALSSESVRLVRYDKRERSGLKPGPPVGSVGLDRRIAAHLEGRMGSLYAYQAEAIRLVLGGSSVVIEAPTAAGKTLAFLAPVAHIVARSEGRGTRALLVYPTNALMRDQLPGIAKIAGSVGRRAGIINGDTPPEARSRLAADPPEMLLTTFDLLHRQMAGHGPLHKMLKTVEILVVDEAHYYNGLLGSNVHHVIARLKRLSGGLQCIAASATLKGSKGFCESLFGEEMIVVGDEGQLATMDFAMMTPAIPAESKGDARLLRHRLMVEVAKKTARRENKALLFSNSRRGAEIVARLAKDAGLRAGIHRSGLDKLTLKRVEEEFREGRLDILSCTPTLELGIDIGSVGTVVSELVPVNRLAQRVGRAGRRGERGFAALVLGNDPISQYYERHTGDYDNDRWEPHIDPRNRGVEDIHTVAMAADRELGPGESECRGEAVERGIAAGLLKREGRAVRATEKGKQEASRHKIRGIGGTVRVTCDGEVIGDRNLPYAIGELHPGALYMHNTATYRIESLDQRRWIARASRAPADLRMHTIPLIEKTVSLKNVLDTVEVFGNEVKYCELEVTLEVKRYIERSFKAVGDPAEARHLGRGIRHAFLTNGVAFWAPRPCRAMGGPGGAGVEEGAYHAIEHVMVEASRMVIGVTHSDMDSKSLPNGTVYMYDRVAGGNGASRALHARMARVVERAMRILDACACRDDPRGCVNCTFSHMCGRENEALHKAGALESLQGLAGRPGG